jgi:hypothetical protein
MSDATASLLLVRDFVNTLDVESGADSLAASGLVDRAQLEEARAVREALRELLIANASPRRPRQRRPPTGRG